jgi:hypothetical protein
MEPELVCHLSQNPTKIAFSCIDRTEAMNEKIDNELVYAYLDQEHKNCKKNFCSLGQEINTYRAKLEFPILL